MAELTAVVVGVSHESPDLVEVRIDGWYLQLPAELFGYPTSLGGRYLLTAEENRNA